ncbi:MAG TPA: hemerythrin domain-containing protein [Rhizomicrobium sp.]|nr:hemerythrin domain-containing protein [Rhizomicrobium sp.]
MNGQSKTEVAGTAALPAHFFALSTTKANGTPACASCTVSSYETVGRGLRSTRSPLQPQLATTNEDCTMAKTEKMDAIALLKADHRKVEELFDKFEKAKDSNKKLSLATEICTELTVHAMIEEEIFYPACKEAVEDDLRTEAYVEHDGAKVLIAELVASDPANEFYEAKMKVLSEQIKHHVKEEERPGEGFFAQARKADIDMDALGEQLAARKKELLAEIKQNGLPPPMTRSFTGHDIEQG